MAVYKFPFFVCFLVIIQCVVLTQASKLNVPRILLPIFSDFSVNFTLEATESGCYKWTTTRIDIVNLIPIEEDPGLKCSSKVIVSTISREQARNIAVVLAEDVHTRQMLRCDVIVDVIDSLSITTTARELFMEEAPEAFEVRAYDNQGNEFTSLEGVIFDWTLVCLGPNKDQTVLRFIRFKDSPYETPPSVKELEEQNQKGHIVLLEGVKTGSAKVSVRLPYDEYKHVKPYEVNLSIIANLIIIPADVYIMIGDVVKFKIIYMNNGKMEEIQLPDMQYYLDVESGVVAVADQQTGEVTGLKEGRTKVILHDRNVDETEVGLKLPSATINVVVPAYMVLNVLPHKNWAVLVSDYHDIVAEVYSSNDHKLHLGPGVEINTQISDEFHVQQRTLNGSWLTGWAVREGVAPVQAALKSLIHPKLGRYSVDPPLNAQGELLIFSRIVLSPSEVILPWDPVIKPKYDVEITATGGDGKFLWSSTNHSVGVVTQSGRVKTHSHGSFEVSAAMMRNHHNRETAKFFILPPSRLEIVEYIMEAEVGSTIFLHVALYAEKPDTEQFSEVQIPFTRCQELPFKVKPSDSKFAENRSAFTEPVGISCANVAVVGLNTGTSKITVSYRQNGVNLEDSVTISAFKPLKLLHPQCDTIVLALGTTAQLVFTGGPKPSLNRPSDHRRSVQTEDITIVTAEDATENHSDPDLTVVSVLCRKLGETSVTLSISNSPLLPNTKTKESVANVRVICGKPRSVALQPKIKVADACSCPMDLSADRVVVNSNEDVELEVAVRDELGRKFLNVSSLKFEWGSKPEDLATLASSDGTFERFTTKGSIVFGNGSYQVVATKTATGLIDVTATVVGYHAGVLKRNKVSAEWPAFVAEEEKGDGNLAPITTTISLYLVENTVVTPTVSSLYNYPGNRRVLTVTQGSGYYELVLSPDDIAEVSYIESSREIEITPLKDGELRIHVIDLCLASRPAVVTVNIVSVHILRVEMSDKVEIGKCISCTLRLYDENDNLMGVPHSDLLDVDVTHGDIVNVEKLAEDAEKPWPLGEIHYIVTGVELGDTKLVFSIGSEDHVVESAPVDLQVFPPLRIYPRNGTLLVGATIQFTSKGGPQPDCDIEYSAETTSIAKMVSEGLAEGLSIGQTRIHAKAVGINPSTGQKVLYSQDSVDLQVIPLNGIKISAPLTRFQVGSTVPIWASGLPEQLSPLILGSVDPPVKFNWFVESPEIARISGIFQPLGIKYKPEDLVSIRLTGLHPGRGRLFLNATVPGSKSEEVFTTSLEIEVFEKLALIEPAEVGGSSILMAPHSTLQLRTNMDRVTKIEYSLPGQIFSSGETANKKDRSLSIPNPLLSVSETGLIQTHSSFGHTMVLMTATDDYGLKQTLSVVVEVKPIHYMILNVISNWQVQSADQVASVPLGTEFELRASYHDNVGNVFTAGSASLKVRNNRMDLVWVKQGANNNSLIVSTKKPGNTVLKVWAEGTQKTVDYVKLNVRQSIVPVVDYLTQGDVLCLYTPVTGRTSEESNHWSSSERNLVFVDQERGIARVVGVRGGTVSLSHTLHPAASLQLSVLPASKIVMLPVKGKTLINTKENGVYHVPLVLLSSRCKDKTSNIINKWQCRTDIIESPITFPFNCFVSFSNSSLGISPVEVFVIKSGFDFETGSYSCDIIPRTESSPNISILDTTVSVWAVVDSSEVAAEPVSIPFVPAVYLETEIVLGDSYSGELLVYGLNSVLDHVTVKAVDENLIYVSDPNRKERNVLKYNIQLVDWHWKLDELEDPLSVVVNSKRTDQIIKVHVKTHPSTDKFESKCGPGRQSLLSSFFYSHKQTLVLIAAMIIMFFITFYAYSTYIQPVINVNVNPNRSLLYAGGHSPCQPPLVQRSQSQPVQVINPCASYRTCYQGSPSRSDTLNCTDTVYGNASQFYSTSPELRRNRRLM